ncbi:MAG: hypothetical protein VKS61_07810 [Candidatus Sericytochromatia bacterium]|nr:hypothetical protein [Candidatus Sericytochromatia bacterium]
MGSSQPHTPSRTLAATASRYLTGTLDNLQRWVDQASSALSRAEVWQVSRQVIGQAIRSSRHAIEQASERAEHEDAWGAARTATCGGVEALRDTVRACADEVTRVEAVATTSHLLEESLELARRQLELSFDALEDLGGIVRHGLEARPGAVTRVEIDAEQVGRVVEPHITTP